MHGYSLDRVRKKLEWQNKLKICLLYTSDAADEGLGVDLGGRRIIKKNDIIATSGFGAGLSWGAALVKWG